MGREPINFGGTRRLRPHCCLRAVPVRHHGLRVSADVLGQVPCDRRRSALCHHSHRSRNRIATPASRDARRRRRRNLPYLSRQGRASAVMAGIPLFSATPNPEAPKKFLLNYGRFLQATLKTRPRPFGASLVITTRFLVEGSRAGLRHRSPGHSRGLRPRARQSGDRGLASL